MALSTSQINFVYSGGSNNSDPSKSLGGNPSNIPILGQINNLFSNVSSAQSTEGKIDYRCFYIFNDSLTDTLHNASVFIIYQEPGGATVQLGLANTTDVQKIQITGIVTGGSLLIKYEDNQFVVNWGGSASSFAANLIAGLTSVNVKGVEIETTSVSNSSNSFSLSFKGDSNNRSHSLLVISQNNLIGTTSVSIKKETEGEPINSVAPLIPTDSTPPARVNFYNTSLDNKLFLGNIGPGDGVPIWAKRTTLANANFKQSDSFTLRLIGNPFNE